MRKKKIQSTEPTAATKERRFIDMVTDTLEIYGIYKGDMLLVQPTDELNESALTVFDVGNSLYLTAFGFENFGDISLMRGDEIIKRLPKSKVKIVGEVLAVLSPLKLQTNGKLVKNKPAEIETVCDKCRRTEKGSEQFLKAQGWDLKRKLCLKCDLL